MFFCEYALLNQDDFLNIKEIKFLRITQLRLF